MSEEKGPTFSPAMRSALQAVARIKGDSTIAFLLLHDDHPDDRRNSEGGPRTRHAGGEESS